MKTAGQIIIQMYTSITFTIDVEKGVEMNFDHMIEIVKDAVRSMEKSCSKRIGQPGCSDYYKVVWSNSQRWAHIEVLQRGEMTRTQSKSLGFSMSHICSHLSRRLGFSVNVTNKSWRKFRDTELKYVV